MNILIKYNEENKKVLIKIEEEEYKELDFTVLLFLSNLVIDDKIDLNINTEGFDNLADIEENYKNIFSQISDLKNNIEINELKEKLKVQEEDKEKQEENIDDIVDDTLNIVNDEDPFADFN